MRNRNESEISVEQPILASRLDLGQDLALVTEAYASELESDADYRKLRLILQDDRTGQKFDFADCLNQINPERKTVIRFAYNFMNHFGGNTRKAIISVPKEGPNDPKAIMAIMHELGHILAYEEDEKKHPDKAMRASGNQFQEGIEAKKLLYIIEQDAWKQGVLQAGHLKKSLGLNVFSFFSSSQEFCDYVYLYLGKYKKQVVDAGSLVTYKTLYDQRFEDFLKSEFEKNSAKVK